jgi:hypothetical protein
MKLNFLATILGTALILAPVGLAQQQDKASSQPQHGVESRDAGVQQAIAFQRAKDRADERQARLEARHPSVDYSNADRQMNDSNKGNVKDPSEPGSQTIRK